MSRPITPPKPSTQVALVVSVAPVAGRPGYFTARLGHRMLVAASRSPFVDSCRTLLARGVNPDTTIAMRHRGADHDALRARLGTAARLTVEESAHGPVFRSYREASPSAVDRPPVASRTAVGVRQPAEVARAYGGDTGT
jgi:hypothetical protein